MTEPGDTGQPARMTPDDLRRQSARYLVVPDLFTKFDALQEDGRVFVMVELNIDFASPDRQPADAPAGKPPTAIDLARREALRELEKIGVDAERVAAAAASPVPHYLFVSLTLDELKALDPARREAAERARADGRSERGAFPMYKVWVDEPLRPFSGRSIRTIKADACLTTFGSDGTGIVVAVADSGIDATHRHFADHRNCDLPEGVQHGDFTQMPPAIGDAALVDEYGHGTHVAGIIAGRFSADANKLTILRDEHVEDGPVGDSGRTEAVGRTNGEAMVLQGVAPKAKLLSLKVLDKRGTGRVSGLIAALEYLFQLNDSGRKLKVHCLNLSLGYPFDAEWYAAGQSPLCVAVTRLVNSGMVVIAAAGNDGSIRLRPEGASDSKRFGLDQSINDPGNAEAAITVGSTHSEAPHLYGVSYFSSRGPTADGRAKPDLLAPGERILSCSPRSAVATRDRLDEANQAEDETTVYYREESGTSMAAPHVAGAVAAFLSIQGEYIGRPDAVKKVFMNSCTDLGRKADFQGAGLIDLMRAVQSV